MSKNNVISPAGCRWTMGEGETAIL